MYPNTKPYEKIGSGGGVAPCRLGSTSTHWLAGREPPCTAPGPPKLRSAKTVEVGVMHDLPYTPPWNSNPPHLHDIENTRLPQNSEMLVLAPNHGRMSTQNMEQHQNVCQMLE